MSLERKSQSASEKFEPEVIQAPWPAKTDSVINDLIKSGQLSPEILKEKGCIVIKTVDKEQCKRFTGNLNDNLSTWQFPHRDGTFLHGVTIEGNDVLTIYYSSENAEKREVATFVLKPEIASQELVQALIDYGYTTPEMITLVEKAGLTELPKFLKEIQDSQKTGQTREETGKKISQLLSILIQKKTAPKSPDIPETPDIDSERWRTLSNEVACLPKLDEIISRMLQKSYIHIYEPGDLLILDNKGMLHGGVPRRMIDEKFIKKVSNPSKPATRFNFDWSEIDTNQHS